MWARRGIHVYLVYSLFGIPPQWWAESITSQTTANWLEEEQIKRYLNARRAR